MIKAGISEHWLVRAARLFLAIWVLFYLIQGLNAALSFNGDPADGPFLIFNSLRRIAAGQVGGRDFVYIHGIGLPYLHYPLFALFGAKTITASELSRQWTSMLLFVLSLWAFTRAALGRTPRVWIGAALSVILIEAFFPLAPMPGNLVVSARSTMPVFTFAVLQLSVSNRLKAVLTGCCLALAFVFGTEHAISLVLALFMVAGLSLIQSLSTRAAGKTFLENSRFAITCLISAAVVGAVVLTLLCGVDGARKAVYFNLVDMPTDQVWFFGGPPIPFLGVWKDFFSRHAILILLPTYVAFLILGWLLIKSWNHPLRIGRDWRALAAVMLVYGIVSGTPLLAILSRHYVFPLARVLVLVSLLLCAKAALPRVLNLSSMVRWRGWSTVAAFLFVTVCFAASLALTAKATARTLGLVRHLRAESSSYSRFLDSHWDTFMTEATRLIDSKRERSRLSIWSAYSGLLESHYGVFPLAEDYIIHASYGPRRWRHYVDTFRAANAEFVTTMTPEFDFEEWLQNERWEFYEAVLDSYEPLRRITHATIWRRKTGPWRAPSQDFHAIQPEPGSDAYVLPVVTGCDRLGVVRVRYAVSNRWGWIPLLGKTPRYVATIEGSPRHLSISFPPYLSEFKFPVQLQPGRPVRIRFSAASLLPGAAFRLDEVQVKILDWDSSQEAVFASRASLVFKRDDQRLAAEYDTRRQSWK